MTPRTSRVHWLQSGLPHVRQKATAATSLCVAQFIRTSCTWSPTLQADRSRRDPEDCRPELADSPFGCNCAPASARAVVLCRSCVLSVGPVQALRAEFAGWHEPSHSVQEPSGCCRNSGSPGPAYCSTC